jgi:hypothetical protein
MLPRQSGEKAMFGRVNPARNLIKRDATRITAPFAKTFLKEEIR